MILTAILRFIIVKKMKLIKIHVYLMNNHCCRTLNTGKLAVTKSESCGFRGKVSAIRQCMYIYL